MTSIHLQSLQTRIATLKQIFLPSTWDPLGNYSDVDREKAAAFTVMAHAEIETYIEARVASYADSREAEWISASAVHHSLLAFVQVAFVDASRQATENDPSVDHLIRLGVRMLKERIGSNHGIKESNLTKLLPAVGIKLTDLPPGLVQAMDSLGVTRGSYAHNSGTSRTLVNPQDEFNNVQMIVGHLSTLDTLTTL